MDEENKNAPAEGAEEKSAEKPKKEKSDKPKDGVGVFAGLQFLTLFLVISVVGLQYLQFNKIVDLEKRMVENDKIVSSDEVEDINIPQISVNDIQMFSIVEKANYNISDGKNKKTLIVTINLGLNKKAKSYKTTTSVLGEKMQIVKEIIESVITSSDISDLDNAGKQENLKKKIISKLSKQFDTDAIVDVYFSDKFIA